MLDHRPWRGGGRGGAAERLTIYADIFAGMSECKRTYMHGWCHVSLCSNMCYVCIHVSIHLFAYVSACFRIRLHSSDMFCPPICAYAATRSVFLWTCAGLGDYIRAYGW